jgi:hypothetical protein
VKQLMTAEPERVDILRDRTKDMISGTALATQTT